MRSGCKLSWFWPRMLWGTDAVWEELYGIPMHAPGQAGNDQVFVRACFHLGGFPREVARSSGLGEVARTKAGSGVLGLQVSGFGALGCFNGVSGVCLVIHVSVLDRATV